MLILCLKLMKKYELSLICLRNDNCVSANELEIPMEKQYENTKAITTSIKVFESVVLQKKQMDLLRQEYEVN